MATIYEIDEAIRACCERVDEETGELLDPEALDALQMEREAKLEGVALYYKETCHMVDDIRAEEKVLAERRKAKEAKAERLKAYLAEHLDGQKFETARVCLSYRASTAVSITDAAVLMDFLEKGHDDCIRYAAPQVDKAKLAALLKQGVQAPGAELEARRNLQIK